MPKDQRALTRATRTRMASTGKRYTEAREDVIAIREIAEENDWTEDEAGRYYDNPANQIMCDDCGWTYGMVCPECAKGCGCEYNCSGWRHREYREDDEPEGSYCVECGANSHYECECHYDDCDDEDGQDDQDDDYA